MVLVFDVGFTLTVCLRHSRLIVSIELDQSFRDIQIKGLMMGRSDDVTDETDDVHPDIKSNWTAEELYHFGESCKCIQH